MTFSVDEAKSIFAFEQRVSNGFFKDSASELGSRSLRKESSATVVKIPRRNVVQGACAVRLVPCTI